MGDKELEPRASGVPKPIDKILLQVMLTLVGTAIVVVITKALLKSDAAGEPGTLIFSSLVGKSLRAQFGLSLAYGLGIAAAVFGVLGALLASIERKSGWPWWRHVFSKVFDGLRWGGANYLTWGVLAMIVHIFARGDEQFDLALFMNAGLIGAAVIAPLGSVGADVFASWLFNRGSVSQLYERDLPSLFRLVVPTIVTGVGAGVLWAYFAHYVPAESLFANFYRERYGVAAFIGVLLGLNHVAYVLMDSYSFPRRAWQHQGHAYVWTVWTVAILTGVFTGAEGFQRWMIGLFVVQ